MPISGVKNASFTEILQELEIDEDLEGLVHSRLEQVLPFTEGEWNGKREKVFEGIARVEGICNRLLEICEQLHPHPPFEHGTYALLEMDLEEDEIYQKVFLPIWQVWQHLLRHSSAYPLAAHLNRWLFLKRICQEYLAALREYYE